MRKTIGLSRIPWYGDLQKRRSLDIPFVESIWLWNVSWKQVGGRKYFDFGGLICCQFNEDDLSDWRTANDRLGKLKMILRPLQNFVDEISAYRYFEISNGERPDIVSQRLYNTPNYHWTFFILNDKPAQTGQIKQAAWCCPFGLFSKSGLLWATNSTNGDDRSGHTRGGKWSQWSCIEPVVHDVGYH